MSLATGRGAAEDAESETKRSNRICCDPSRTNRSGVVKESYECLWNRNGHRHNRLKTGLHVNPCEGSPIRREAPPERLARRRSAAIDNHRRTSSWSGRIGRRVGTWGSLRPLGSRLNRRGQLHEDATAIARPRQRAGANPARRDQANAVRLQVPDPEASAERAASRWSAAREVRDV